MQVKNPVRPWFTYFVIFLCSVMLLVEFGLNDWKVEPLSTNPLIGPSAQALVDSGARETNLIIQGQWFRLFSPLFLHAGVIHYGTCTTTTMRSLGQALVKSVSRKSAAFTRNVAGSFISCQHGGVVVHVSPHLKTMQGFHSRRFSALTDLLCHGFSGGAVEESHGILNGVFLFFVPGIGGNILSSIFLPQYISVGASGGIFGLIGGCIADLTLNWKLLFISGADQDTSASKRNFAAILCLVMEIVVNLLIGLTPYGTIGRMSALVEGRRKWKRQHVKFARCCDADCCLRAEV
jgi:membrane associated rhomboid family serine protease